MIEALKCINIHQEVGLNAANLLAKLLHVNVDLNFEMKDK